MGDSMKGRNFCVLIGGYMAVKSLINLLLGLNLMNIVWLAVNIALAYALIKAMPQMNIVTGVFLALMFLINAKNNISGHHWFYLGEGIIDALCAVALFINKDIKAFFGRE